MTHEQSPERGEKPSFGRRYDIDQAFAEIIRSQGYEFNEALQVETPSLHVDNVINVIDKLGIKEAARQARALLEFENGDYMPADPSEVRLYLADFIPSRPFSIADIGSLDHEVVEQLHLSKDRFPVEIEAIFKFIDDEALSVSVLEMPKLYQKMVDWDLKILERGITFSVLEEHGIARPVFDASDPAAWNRIREFTEMLCSEPMRDYSDKLRQIKSRGEWTPIRDAIDTIDERHEIRMRAYNIAHDNLDATPVERQRILQGNDPYLRPHINYFFEELDALAETD